MIATSSNKFVFKEDYCLGYTTNGQEFIFDIEDYPLVNQCTWSVGGHGYLQGCINKQMFLMHRLLTKCPKGLQVDHINHNKLDNRKVNLRICTQHFNQMNERISKNNTSGFTGVSYDKRDNKWDAYLMFNRKKISLGSFDDIKDAIKARKDGEQKYYGEFSYDNSQKFIQEIGEI